MTGQRRIMAIDHGEAHIGVALSDPFGLFATPHCVIACHTPGSEFEALRAIVEQEQIAKIVIGLPTSSQGGIGSQAAIVIRWSRKLAQHVTAPIVLWDESYSSIDASKLRRPKHRRGRRPGPIDDIAAATILQEYLDAGGASDHEPGYPLETFKDLP